MILVLYQLSYPALWKRGQPGRSRTRRAVGGAEGELPSLCSTPLLETSTPIVTIFLLACDSRIRIHRLRSVLGQKAQQQIWRHALSRFLPGDYHVG